MPLHMRYYNQSLSQSTLIAVVSYAVALLSMVSRAVAVGDFVDVGNISWISIGLLFQRYIDNRKDVNLWGNTDFLGCFT